MILDRLEHADAYPLGERFRLGFEYLRSGRAETDALGRHDLDGDNVYALVQEYETKPLERGKWEAHVKHADIQYVVTGRERMGFAPLHTLTLREQRPPAEDAALYDGDGTHVPLTAGMFAVFLPQDGHMPGIADGEPQKVRKVVVEVRLEG